MEIVLSPLLREVGIRIRASDPLGLTDDFGSSETLALLSRKRFEREPTVERLICYQALMLEIAVCIMAMPNDALAEREWFVCECDEAKRIQMQFEAKQKE